MIMPASCHQQRFVAFNVPAVAGRMRAAAYSRSIVQHEVVQQLVQLTVYRPLPGVSR